MAAPNRLLTVNLGSQAISIADFRPQSDGGLILRGWIRREVVPDNPLDPIRPQQITSVLQEMLHELGLKTCRVNYAISAQSVFTRFVKLPAVDPKSLHRSGTEHSAAPRK